MVMVVVVVVVVVAVSVVFAVVVAVPAVVFVVVVEHPPCHQAVVVREVWSFLWLHKEAGRTHIPPRTTSVEHQADNSEHHSTGKKTKWRRKKDDSC